MKNRVYESLTTVFSVLVVSSFLYIWFATYLIFLQPYPGPRAGSLLPVLQENCP